MLRFLLLSALALAGTLAAARARAQAAGSPLGAARQAVLVVADGWDDTRATLRRFERDSPTAPWRPVGESVPVALGRSGLAWGIGLHPEARGGSAPRKREGDGRAPAGVFRVGAAFGYAPALEGVRLPYLHSTPDLRCPDDPASAHYNRLVDQRRVRKDWASAEEMRRDDPLYRIGAVVEHNWGERTRPGGGSCIFLHVWREPGAPTAGCTAMAEPALAAVLRWLDPARDPVLVQLPAAEHRRLKAAWRLP